MVPTRRGVEQLRRILETLARVELTDGLRLPELIGEVEGRMPRDATVIVILPEVTTETVVTLEDLKRRGFAVTAILNMHEEYEFAAAAGPLSRLGHRYASPERRSPAFPASANGLCCDSEIASTMVRRLRQTLMDYMVIGISPALIMGMVGSLLFFLLTVFYHGQYGARLNFIFAMFTMAIVLIARISMEEGIEYASLFAIRTGHRDRLGHGQIRADPRAVGRLQLLINGA